MIIRVTVDTNVLVSATFWHGASARIFDKIENKEIVLVLSEEILEEYYRVLEYDEIKEKIRDRQLEMKESVLKIRAIAEIINVTSRVTVVSDDPTDNKIIECAIDGKVDYLITQDRHLLKIKKYQSIIIITPEEFLKIVK